MDHIIVTGIGTNVGKTVVSAIFTTMLNGSYWKPIECGPDSDTTFMRSWAPTFPPSFTFKAPFSPHHAARLEKKEINTSSITIPEATPLVIESAGGILVPLNEHELNLDLFLRFKGVWIVVSRHYLGSINHTLLTLKILKHYGITPLIVFNGANKMSEEAITSFSKVPLLGSLQEEDRFTKPVLKKYAQLWKTRFGTLIPPSMKKTLRL